MVLGLTVMVRTLVVREISWVGQHAQPGNAYWTESRPSEKGRQVIVRRTPSGTVADVTPGVESGFNIRTRVHEYGGGASWMGEQYLYFVNFAYVHRHMCACMHIHLHLILFLPSLTPKTRVNNKNRTLRGCPATHTRL